MCIRDSYSIVFLYKFQRLIDEFIVYFLMQQENLLILIQDIKDKTKTMIDQKKITVISSEMPLDQSVLSAGNRLY